MNNSGVYQILNDITGNFYIGSTKNFEYRWKKHKSALINNKHKNSHLQSAWNKYGGENFSFHVLERCPPEKIRTVEQFYIDQGCHYNKSKRATGGGGSQSEEVRQKISQALQGNTPWNKGKKATEEARRNQSKGHLGKTPGNKGITLSEEAKSHLSRKSKEQWDAMSEAERKARTSRLHESNRGTKRSEETRRRISEAKKLGYQRRRKVSE